MFLGLQGFLELTVFVPLNIRLKLYTGPVALNPEQQVGFPLIYLSQESASGFSSSLFLRSCWQFMISRVKTRVASHLNSSPLVTLQQ